MTPKIFKKNAKHLHENTDSRSRAKTKCRPRPFEIFVRDSLIAFKTQQIKILLTADIVGTKQLATIYRKYNEFNYPHINDKVIMENVFERCYNIFTQ